MHTTLYQNFLNTVKFDNRLRSLPELSGAINLDFSTNDYLNLSHHSLITESIKKNIDKVPYGATGSRLLSGHHDIFSDLEKKIASDKHQEKALYFSSGFLANYSCLKALLDSAILKKKPLVFFHKRNHNSLYQAVFEAQCDLIRFTTLQDLEEKLSIFSQEDRPKFLVTETVFGMDGDIIDIFKIKALAQHHQLFVMLDEAHASGILGPQGLGISRCVDFENIPVLIMGTFSKALGVCGAYVASSCVVIDYLINKASGFIYSTAPSPLIAHACSLAWDLAKQMEKQRAHTLALAAYLKASLQDKGFTVLGDKTPIVPLVLQEDQEVLNKKQLLKNQGILVSAIRYPTVAKKQARLRLSVKASHTYQDIDHLIEVLL